MTRYSYIPRQCRRHGFQRPHAKTKCYFCYQRSYLGDYNAKMKITPEEYLLRQIFFEGRFIISRKRKERRRPIPPFHRKYKGPKLGINPPTGRGDASLVYSWTDGSSIFPS